MGRLDLLEYDVVDKMHGKQYNLSYKFERIWVEGDSYIESLYSRIDHYHIGITKQAVSKYETGNAILLIEKNKRTSRREIGNVISFTKNQNEKIEGCSQVIRECPIIVCMNRGLIYDSVLMTQMRWMSCR